MTKLYPGLPDAASLGGPAETLTDDQIRAFVLEQLGDYDFDGKRVTLVVPDGTRHAPVDKVSKYIHEALGNRPKDVRVVIALGTAALMLFGYALRRYRQVRSEATYNAEQIRRRIARRKRMELL